MLALISRVMEAAPGSAPVSPLVYTGIGGTVMLIVAKAVTPLLVRRMEAADKIRQQDLAAKNERLIVADAERAERLKRAETDLEEARMQILTLATSNARLEQESLGKSGLIEQLELERDNWRTIVLRGGESEG